MAGYTPSFDSIYTGTLYGKWPAAAVWASLLPLFDKNGVLDLSIDAICGMSGWPRDLLETGIEQLCQPDPHSRTKGEEGRRMVLLDPDRTWGWRAVNHARYREKARLLSKNEREVGAGKNAERMRDRRGPPGTAADPLSYSYADSYSDLREDKTRGVRVCGSNLTRSPEEISGGEAWKDVGGINVDAFTRWLTVSVERGKSLDGAGRISLAKWLAGQGDLVKQAAVVEQSVRGGWKNLRALESESAKRSNSVTSRIGWRPEGA